MRLLAAAILISTATLAQSLAPPPPHSGFEPPAAAKAASIAESTKAAPKEFLTRAETSNFEDTGRYAESLGLYRKFAAASPLAKLLTLGHTPEGREIVMLVISKDRAFTPEAAAKTGKTTILLQNGIHAGEIAGKDATAMLIRDILITKRLASLLDHAIILAIPVFNVDGHERFSPYNRVNQNGPREMGWRANSQRLNLNRDYIKADTPEMRAWLAMYTKWLPDLLIDNHVTDGEDHQYDVTYAIATGPDVAPPVGAWTRDKFLPEFLRQLNADGHMVAPYGHLASDGYHGMVFPPRFSNGYAAIQNRAGLLVETHSLKSFRTRVWTHYDVMRHAIELASPALHQAVARADREVAQLAGTETKVHLNGDFSHEGTPFDFHGVASQEQQSTLSGTLYRVYLGSPIDTPTMLYDQLVTTAAGTVPAAYIIPCQWTSLIELLKIHGVETRTLDHEITAGVPVATLIEPHWDEKPFEGRHRVQFHIEQTDQPRTFPAGSIIVPMKQRAARVALNILEPAAPDSAVTWGFLDSIFEQKEEASSYIMEPIAQSMMLQHDDLRAAFQKRLREDPTFSADGRARLRWWYDHSLYAESDRGVYPVFRLAQEPARSPAGTAPAERRSPPPPRRSAPAK
jgi:hypothetical protein